MALNEITITKLYYSISEVADMFSVKTSLVRFYEREFDVIKPSLNKKGNRQFTPKDIEYFKIIFDLVREQGMTLEGVKKYFAENKKVIKHELKANKNQFSEIENKLKKIRKELIALNENLK